MQSHMCLLNQVNSFLQTRWDQKSPLLLGYSGGPDSKVLLDILLRLQVPFHVAHVDHGWREESEREAATIRDEIEALGLPFHTTRLMEPCPREAVAREKRLLFFSSLFEKVPFQALLLAHHADDLAETALKRALEGAHLVSLSGLNQVAHLKGMSIWRPLLSVQRREILAYLQENKLQALQDPTNLDPAYLRARMRLEILPNLAASFGKEITKNLTLLASRSCELKEYLDRKVDQALKLVKRGPLGLVLPPVLEEPVELRHALQLLGIETSREILEGLVEALIKKLPSKKFTSRLIADRGYLFFLTDKLPAPMERIALQEGVFFSGDWRIEVTEALSHFTSGGWLDLFLGDVSFLVSPGDGYLQMPSSPAASLYKRLQQQKIPAFLRAFTPCLDGPSKSLVDLFSLSHKQGYRVRFSVCIK